MRIQRRWSRAPAGSAEHRQAELFFEDLTGGPTGASEGAAEAISSFDDIFGEAFDARPPPPAPPRRVPYRPRPARAEPPAAPVAYSADEDTAYPPAARAEDNESIQPVESGFAPMEDFGSDNVRIVLRNDDGTPAANVAFRARFRDGRVVNGTLDANGEATIADHTHGDVTVTFPGLPAASWEISSFGGS